MLERDRRSVIKGAAVALLSVGTVSAAGGSEKDSDMRTLHWDDQGRSEQGKQDNKPTTQNCAENETAYWYWVLTPGGSEPIEEGANLQVFFEDNSSDSDEGEPRGEGQGAVHFTVSKEGGGTVESATVSFEGGGDEARLVLRNRWCKAGAEKGDETEDDGGKPDEGDDETDDGSDKPGEDSEQEPSEEEEDGDDPDEEKDTEDDENGAGEDETSDDGGTGDNSEQDPGEEEGDDPDEEGNTDDDENEADEDETGDDTTDDADGTDDNTNGTDEDSDEENPSDADGEDDGESEYGGDETGSEGSDETHHC